ncbi:MAG TPA: carboxypeptidase-like regulatory domain-containing protein [Bacteroidales bacterium]|nr:carboxypeptidase-like regulatory domain-containing protein [Bacteroidales bacterium]
MRKSLLFIAGLLCTTAFLSAQQKATVKGIVSDENGPLPGASIIDLNTRKGTVADADGSFQLVIPANKQVQIEFSFVGYKKDTLTVTAEPGETIGINTKISPLPGQVGEVVVESWYDRAEALQQITIGSVEHLPLPSGNIESILTTMGASSRNEMSSQYSVRGGNFDENLIYVNGIQIYKPLLVKAGQQEGLSFINPSMVSSIQFAAGGFDARYGDKMSSVLDIRYKRPVAFGASASASLLGASAHVEGTALKNRFTHITGIRYKSNQYLIKSMQTEGDFKPNFFDFQTFLTYDVTSQLELSFLGNASVNTYNVIPQSRETAFGTYQEPLNFRIYYEGQEKDRFATMLGALSLNYRISDKLSMGLTASSYSTSEKITYDILGQYWIDLLDNTPGSKTAGDSILNLGYGGNLLHARNFLDATIMNVNYKGTFTSGNHQVNWGIGVQYESFDDRLKEWEMIDSAGFTMPYSDEAITLQHVVNAKNRLNSNRFNSFVQDMVNLQAGETQILVNAGIRFNYLTTNEQFLVSPRVRVTFIPDWENKISFHTAVGWYYQPPFYKEMRDPQGKLYPRIKAQRSIDFTAGMNLDFLMWNRPFRLTSEVYYKNLNHLVPYIIDDVDIQYLPQYSAKGYATGIEFKINGEFVKDAESWASLSFLRTREDRIGDRYGSYPRASDQLVNFGLYFQDYFPSNPSYRLNLNVYFGSRLPYNSYNYDNPLKYYHLQAYRRIDIGITKSLMSNRFGETRVSRTFKDISFTAEIFNLFGFKNEASFQWIRTVRNQEGIPNVFAVPNYLTGRMLNVKISVKF